MKRRCCGLFQRNIVLVSYVYDDQLRESCKIDVRVGNGICSLFTLMVTLNKRVTNPTRNLTPLATLCPCDTRINYQNKLIILCIRHKQRSNPRQNNKTDPYCAQIPAKAIKTLGHKQPDHGWTNALDWQKFCATSLDSLFLPLGRDLYRLRWGWVTFSFLALNRFFRQIWWDAKGADLMRICGQIKVI
jgi:hypothetical protein